MERNSTIKNILIIILILIIIGLIMYIISKENKEIISEEYVSDNIVENIVQDDINIEESDIVNELNDEKNIKNEEKYIQFNNKFCSLEDVSKEYRLSENIKNYKDFNYDLDGDGTEEKITIEKDKTENTYVFKLNDDEFDRSAFRPEIYIVDLNEEDDNIEVVIFDEGPSDDPAYSIFTKQKDSMKLLENISGNEFKCDKKGIVIVDDFYNGHTVPALYFHYYIINDGNIEIKRINIQENGIKNIDFKDSYFYFSGSENYLDDFDKAWEDFNNGKNIIEALNDVGIEQINNNITFNVINVDFEKDKYGIEDYKIQVELSDGRKGYLFHLQFAG